MDWLANHLGELASLGAALCWVFTSMAFAAAGRRIGPTAVNLIRIFLAVLVLLCIHRAVFSDWMPQVEARGLILLGVSGLIGLVIGDQCFLIALVDVGPRLTLLLATLAPPMAAILAWPMLDERLGGVQIAGIMVTLAGIAWVVLERPDTSAGTPARRRHRLRGIICGGLGGVCQATGLVLSKLGMGHVPGEEMNATATVDPWSATLVRMVFAAGGIAILATSLRLGRRTMRASRNVAGNALAVGSGNRRAKPLGIAMLMVCVGVALGPVLGVWCSMVGVDRAEAGVAATLMAMSPVFILPLAVVFERERVSPRAALGAMIAVAGVALLTIMNGSNGY
ncbi:MAG: DMT family transporter [Phycisphaerales bacterium]|nr:MAG: DMT family transporter [Phycisphaerales bacterium]